MIGLNWELVTHFSEKTFIFFPHSKLYYSIQWGKTWKIQNSKMKEKDKIETILNVIDQKYDDSDKKRKEVA